MNDIDIHLELQGPVLVARLVGDIDASNSKQVRTRIFEFLTNDQLGLVLDITGVQYIDSAGTRTLFDLSRGLAERGQHMRVIAEEDSTTARLLKIVGIDSSAPMCTNLKTAVDSIRAAA